MPLIKCIDCGKEFSSYAKACPNCGCPTEVVLQLSNQGVPVNNVPVASVKKQVAPIEEESKTVPAVIPPLASDEISATDSDVPACSEVSFDGGTCYGIKKSLDPSTFYRDALMALTIDSGTPPDIFSGEFEPVTESNKHLAKIIGNVNGSYTAQIGYDMVRTYTDYQGGRAVKKQEKYIEWQPFAGNYADSQLVLKSLDKDPLDEGVEVAYGVAILDHALESQQEGTNDVLLPTQQQINEAMEECKELAARECQKALPGDHNKDFNFSGFAQLDNCTCHTIPAYSVPFRYKGEEYKKSYFAMKDHAGASFGRIPDISDEIHARVDKKLRPLGIVALVLLSLSIVVALTFGALHEYLYRAVGLSVSLPIFAAAISTTISYWVIHKKKHKSILKTNLEIKVQTVDAVLVKNGLAPLSEEEKDVFLGRVGK